MLLCISFYLFYRSYGCYSVMFFSPLKLAAKRKRVRERESEMEEITLDCIPLDWIGLISDQEHNQITFTPKFIFRWTHSFFYSSDSAGAVSLLVVATMIYYLNRLWRFRIFISACFHLAVERIIFFICYYNQSVEYFNIFLFLLLFLRKFLLLSSNCPI